MGKFTGVDGAPRNATNQKEVSKEHGIVCGKSEGTIYPNKDLCRHGGVVTQTEMNSQWKEMCKEIEDEEIWSGRTQRSV